MMSSRKPGIPARGEPSGNTETVLTILANASGVFLRQAQSEDSATPAAVIDFYTLSRDRLAALLSGDMSGIKAVRVKNRNRSARFGSGVVSAGKLACCCYNGTR
jgi:hypothetical protein